MNFLAFDTATEQMSVALTHGEEVLSSERAGGALASATLIPTIMEVLARAGMRLGDLDAIAFGRGPGAFTGLRTACAVAQGLAFGAAKPVLPIDTLLALAESARSAASETVGFTVWALLDARMNEIYAARYRLGASGWQVLDAPMLTTAATLNALWQNAPPEALAGRALTAFAGQLETGNARLFSDAAPGAVAMLSLARSIWQAGGGVDAALALPLYLRDKVAQTTLEREAARAARETAAGSGR